MPSPLEAMFSTTSSHLSSHLWLTYGWLAATGLAPVVLVLTIWAVGRQATYRSSWRPLDVLLAGLLIGQLPSTVGVLVLGAIKGTLVHLPRLETTRRLVCYLLVWATATGRIYAVALLTALLADRAAILRWPYRYRFAVRHTQARLFLVLLAVGASLAGVAAVYGHWLKDEEMIKLVVNSHLLGSNQTNVAENSTSLMTLDSSLTSSFSTSTSYRFTFDPATFDQRYNYLSAGLYLLFAAFSAICTLYVECKRPRGVSNSGISLPNSSNAANGKNSRYLPSLFTVAANSANTTNTGTGSSTSTTSSSSTSSSLSASGSPPPSRFSSLANLTANNGKQQPSANNQQPSNLPAFYYGGGKSSNANRDAKAAEAASNTLNSLYPISIVDLMSTNSEMMAIGSGVGGGNGIIGGGGTYASMSTTTDNSIYRLIDGSGHHNPGSRSNSLSKDVNESSLNHHHHLNHHRSTANNHHHYQSDSAAANCSSLDPLNPPTTSGTNTATNTSSSRVNSFSTRTPSSSNVAEGIFTTQIGGENCGKLNLGDSFSAMTNSPHHLRSPSSSAFDLRWCSVLGPVTFCLAFNHGPYLIFTILGLTVPGFWTPFHDLILVGLTLLEALLLPLIFTLCDGPFRGAVRRSCVCVHVRRSDKISLGDGGGKLGDSLPPPPSMAFGEIGGLRNGKSAFAPSALSPPYLHSPPTKSNALGLSDYQSELDLSKSVDKLKSSHHFSSRLNLNHLHDHHLHHLTSSSTKHATSMLDLSRSNGGTPYHHPHPHPHYQQQHPQTGASRSRHSLALLQHLPPLFGGGSNSNTNSPTPRSSFRRRPPSVASYHYLLSSSPSTAANNHSSSKQNLSQIQSQNNQNNSSKFPPPPQYLFGGVVPSKSETTLNCTSTGQLPLPLSSANYTPPMMMMSNNHGNHHLHHHQLKEIQEGHEMEATKLNPPPLSRQISEPAGRTSSPVKCSAGSPPPRLGGKGDPSFLGSGLISAARSSFKRRSVRKSGSDASTFFQNRRSSGASNQQHLKRSQIAQSQLSNILYNNFYTKKAAGLMNPSGLFGSQTTLLEDQQEFQQHQQQISSPRMTNLPARHLSYDFSQQSPAMLGNSHVYLPNTSHLELLGARSNSCNQLSSVAGLGDYHNHLLMRPNGGFGGLMASDGGYSGSPRVKSNDLRGKFHEEVGSAEEEHIYASLPEEVEEEEEEEEEETEQNGVQGSSGSFSARSTLPDNCQLSSFRESSDNFHCTAQMSTFYNSKNAAASESQHRPPQLTKHSSSSTGSTDGSGDGGSSSSGSSQSSKSGGARNLEEDIYEEVEKLLPIKSSESEEQQRLARRSASQDTLTAGDNDTEDANQEEKENEDEADDDDGDIEEDRVSMLSEASSSSTFSSFTTCANQDFEFTFVASPTLEEQPFTNNSEVESTTLGRRTSQQKSTINNSSAKVPLKNQQQTKTAAVADPVKLQIENAENDNNSQQPLSPNTLSMAAMYYNRFILNEASAGHSGKSKSGKGKGGKGGSGSGHRQRPKVNRRQSFSTAYELRQRILTSQMSNKTGVDGGNSGEMELIEEGEEGEDHNYQVHHNLDLQNHFEDPGLLSYRLSRRISTSEDNLLSIISTMANCGDGEGSGSGNSSDQTTVDSSSSPSSKSNSSSSTPSKTSSSTSSAVTFVKREQSRSNGGGLYNKKQPRNLSNRAVPTSSISFSSSSANLSSAIPRAANLPNSTTTTTHATNISIKELKSKKKKLAQAQAAANSKTANTAIKTGDNFQLRPKSALNGSGSNDKIVELGSLWNRSSAAAPVPAKISAKTPPQPRFSATSKLLAAFNNNSTTVTTGTSSSPSTPCRVPTFIPAHSAAMRNSPTTSRGKLEQNNGHFFASKLTPPSAYIGVAAASNRAVKQSQARQNAILAKNALSGGGGNEHERL